MVERTYLVELKGAQSPLESISQSPMLSMAVFFDVPGRSWFEVLVLHPQDQIDWKAIVWGLI